MKGDDLDFASKLSLMQRHIETAQLNVDSANELARALVGGFERMQRVLMADEFRRQEHLTEQTRRDGMMTAKQFAEEFLQFATGKKTERAEPVIISGGISTAADEVQRPKKNMTTAQLEQLARARAARQDLKQLSNGKLKPIERKFSKEWGMYPYPHFIKTYIEQHPGETFQAGNVAKFIEELGYLTELKPVRQALSHQQAMGVLRNIVSEDGTGVTGRAALYLATGRAVTGTPTGRGTKTEKNGYEKKVTLSIHGKRIGRPPLAHTKRARRAVR